VQSCPYRKPGAFVPNSVWGYCLFLSFQRIQYFHFEKFHFEFYWSVLPWKAMMCSITNMDLNTRTLGLYSHHQGLTSRIKC
jgi:hypothetical protein